MQAASRAVFDSIHAFMQARARERPQQPAWTQFVLERASVDECYIDCTDLCHRSLAAGGALAADLREHVQQRTSISVSVGVSRNRLLAKLASVAAKRDNAAERIKLVGTDCAAFLRSLPADKLPGLGNKNMSSLARLRRDRRGVGSGSSCCDPFTIADLQAFDIAELREHLTLPSQALAQQVWEHCRGVDAAEVQRLTPPRSLVVSSWRATTHTVSLSLSLTHTHTHTHTHTYIHIYVYTYIHACIRIYIYVCTYMHACIHTYVCENKVK